MKKYKKIYSIGALILTFALMGVAGAVAYAQSETGYNETFHAVLEGENQVPPIETDSNGYAFFGTESTSTGDQIHYEIQAHSEEHITAAHIHCGVVGTNGPVIVGLFEDEAGVMAHGSLAEGTIVASDIMPNLEKCSPGINSLPHLIQALRERTVYVNIHSTEHPNGIIRGQAMRGAGMPLAPIVDENEDGDEEENEDSEHASAPTSVTEAAILRVALNNLLTEHVSSSLEVLRDIYDNSPSVTGSLMHQDANAADLGGVIGSVFGNDAEDAFLVIFRDHIEASNDYTRGLTDMNESEKAAALAALDAQLIELRDFFVGAIPSLPSEGLLTALREHEDLLNSSMDAYALGDYETAYNLERTARVQISGGADLIAEGIVDLYPDKF